MVETHGIDKLRRAILHEAREAARAQVQQAEAVAAAAQERARREAESERLRILRDAEREAKAIRRRIGSTAELESKRRLLEARERLIRQVLDQALAQLKEDAGTGARRAVLLCLVVEAAREIGGGRLVVQTAGADVKLLSDEFLAEVRGLLAKEGILAELRAAERPAGIAGGAIVSTDDFCIVVDNSFEARLRRQEASLRRSIWHILSGKE